MSTRDVLLRLMVLALVVGASVTCTGRAAMIPGTPTPTFSLPAARGGAGQLRDGSGRVVLLAFINTQAPAPAAPATSYPSRAQLPFLKSMREQYGDALRVLIVDASALATGRRSGSRVGNCFGWMRDMPPRHTQYPHRGRRMTALICPTNGS